MIEGTPDLDRRARSSFEPLDGKNLTGSISFESQSTAANGRHFVSNPVRPSNATESAAASANSLNRALRRQVRTRRFEKLQTWLRANPR
jgi:hypothetical protein